MHPFLWEAAGSNGPLRIPAYGMLVLSAFMAAFLMVHTRAVSVGIRPERLPPLYVASAIGGLLGAKLLYAVAVDGVMKLVFHPFDTLFTAGGLAFYGGLIGGAIAVLGTAAYLKLPGWKLVDILAPALVMGMGIGRLGCFMAGCCHGVVAEIDQNALALLDEHGFLHGQIYVQSTFPYVLNVFHDGVGRIKDVPIYPTQLWDAFALIGFSLVLTALWRVRRFDGMLAGLMMLIEPMIRIFVESYRGDERGYAVSWAVASVPSWLPPGFVSAGEGLPTGDPLHPSAILVGLTTSQFLGLGFMAIGATILVYRFATGAGVDPEVALEDE
jgi:phosphatidylglycerol---prolipoprotein diacylglyceryl transferase